MTAKKDPKLTRSEALSKAWKDRKTYKGYTRGKGTAFSSWRAILYTEKGQLIGFPTAWREFSVFMQEVAGEWQHGRIVCRYDRRKPHSKENSYWAEKGTENNGKLVIFAYKEQEKTLLEWSKELNLNYQGVRQRYFKGKNLTPEEVLFGKKRKIRTPQERDFAFRTLRMTGAYRLRDAKRGLANDLTIEMVREIISNPCAYCGDSERIGLDRIDNTQGHTIKNVVPCCYVCNCARNDNFSHEEMFVIGKAIRQIKEQRNATNQ